MNVADFITELCCKIDDALPNFPHHPQAILSLGELAAIGVLHATKNVSRFLAQPTVLGVADSYGIELRHPIREGRRERKIVKKGVSNHRWPRIGVRADVIVEGKLGIVQNQWGLIADWDCATAPGPGLKPTCVTSWPPSTDWRNGMDWNRTKTDASIVPSLTSPSDTN